MKKFEPHYRLVRVGLANKIEKASRQQRTFPLPLPLEAADSHNCSRWLLTVTLYPKQASSARTDRRLSAVPRRSRVPRPRRRNRRLAPHFPSPDFSLSILCLPAPSRFLPYLERHLSRFFELVFGRAICKDCLWGFGRQVLLRAGWHSKAERKIPYPPRWRCPS